MSDQKTVTTKRMKPYQHELLQAGAGGCFVTPENIIQCGHLVEDGFCFAESDYDGVILKLTKSGERRIKR